MTHTPNILVLCTGNSCRSQMAEGFLRFYAGDRAVVYSAGVETHGVNARAVTVMSEKGIDISRHTSNHVAEYADVEFDVVITVCDHAAERCPVFPSRAKRLHHSFPDPAKAVGGEEDVLREFRNVRDMIQEYCRDVIESLCDDHLPS